MDNNRFGPLKTNLDNNFLMGGQEDSSDVLRVKRLTLVIIPAAVTAKHRWELTKPADVAFIETKEQQWSLTYYACVK